MIKLKYLYWKIIPYDWRPGQIWYRLKCWIWHRYSTIKPRYLGHTWCDRSYLLPHMMFEILSQFVEKECSYEFVEWYGENGHKINDKYVRDEMQDLYDWWHYVYNKEYAEVSKILWAEANKHKPHTEFIPIVGSDSSRWDPQFNTEEDKLIWRMILDAINKLDRRMDQDLQERLHRLVNIIPYLWT